MITQQQLEARRHAIGGSDIPIILGLSNYKTPYQLFLEKKGLLKESIEISSLQHWGHKIEPLIREEFEIRNKVKVSIPDTIIHPFFDYLQGNLDGFIKEWNAVLEIKCANQWMSEAWGSDGSDTIPLAYLTQVAHYCSITNSDIAYIAVLIGGHDYREFKYIRDLEIEKKVNYAATDFWERLTKNLPPPPTAPVDLKLMFPRTDPEKIKVAEGEIEEYLSELYEATDKMKTLKEEQEELKFSIMKYMEDAECLVNQDGSPLVTWKYNKKDTRVFLLKNN